MLYYVMVSCYYDVILCDDVVLWWCYIMSWCGTSSVSCRYLRIGGTPLAQLMQQLQHDLSYNRYCIDLHGIVLHNTLKAASSQQFFIEWRCLFPSSTPVSDLFQTHIVACLSLCLSLSVLRPASFAVGGGMNFGMCAFSEWVSVCHLNSHPKAREWDF